VSASSLLKSVSRFDRANWRPASATRCTIGLAIPIFAAVATGHASAGILAGLGALYAGMASFQGTFRTRLRLMVGISVAMAVVTFLGGLVSGSPWLVVATISVAALPLALYSFRGRSANTLSVQVLGTLIVLSGIPQTPAEAAGNAVLVLGGAAFQTLVLLVVWPFNLHRPESRAVAAAFSSLSDYVARLRAGDDALMPDAAPFSEARDLIAPILASHPTSERRLLMHALRTGDAIRAAAVAYARPYAAMREQGGVAAERAESVIRDLEATLRSIEDRLTEGDLRSGEKIGVGFFESGPREAMDVHIPDGNAGLWKEHQDWAELIRQELLDTLRLSPNESFALATADRQPFLASLRFDPIVLKHSLRYALVVGFSSALSHMMGLGHAYWLPLTAAIIHRPDYATTLQRGLARLIGTVAGVAISTLIVDFMHPSPFMGTILVLAAAWFALATYLANYAAFATALTLFVVFSIATAGAEQVTALLRLEATFIGVAVAILGYFVWPIWQSRQVWGVIREAARAQVTYGEAVISILDGTSDVMPDEIRHHTRSLRLQAETLVEAAEVEPRWARGREINRACEDVTKIDEHAALLLSLHAEALQARQRGYGAESTKAKVLEIISSAQLLAERT